MAGLALVAVSTAVVAGAHVSATATLPGLNRSGDTNYARNAIGKLAPVSAKYITSRVGHVPGTHLDTPTTTTTRPHTRPSTPPPEQSAIHGTPGAIPGLAPGGWVLTLKMVPDRTTARAGDEIRYRMIITNTGTDDFRGRSFVLEWHTPNGTLGRNAVDQCNLVPTAIVQSLCGSQRVLVSPGLGDTHHERFNSSGLIVIPAGQQWTHDWYVQVLPSNTVGATIFNHAHLNVSLSGHEFWIRTPDVVVTVTA